MKMLPVNDGVADEETIEPDKRKELIEAVRKRRYSRCWKERWKKLCRPAKASGPRRDWAIGPAITIERW